MRSVTSKVVIVCAVVVGAGIAAAQNLGLPPGRWWERPRVAEQLGLSAEQKATLNTETIAHARALVDLKAAVEKAELDLRVLAEAEPFNGKATREAFANLQRARQRLESERFEMLVKVREILTAGQWQRLQALASELPDKPLEGQRPQPRRRW